MGGQYDSVVGWTVLFKAKADDHQAFNEQLTDTVEESLDAENIGILYPSMDIHVYQNQTYHYPVWTERGRRSGSPLRSAR